MTLRGYAVWWALAVASAAGCAGGHATMRGSVVMRIDQTKAHVCLGRGEVAVKDHVRLYKNECAQRDRRIECKKTPIGEGTVTELLDDHYSIVTFPEGIAFEEGSTIEKL